MKIENANKIQLGELYWCKKNTILMHFQKSLKMNPNKKGKQYGIVVLYSITGYFYLILFNFVSFILENAFQKD
ncbi:hypothetical protein FHS10_003389 [Mucilaginibacter dorajii]|uniref:hypothetical protein n=1 Tax=Mucilaginibacter dorajii TaxID=692994 RepID=UPI00216A7718|nr:hypothetical protein [Mucilaginibacter dorajii]MCS3735429.1 hypothetical protein [Mucilaginibacter dorajii]